MWGFASVLCHMIINWISLDCWTDKRKLKTPPLAFRPFFTIFWHFVDKTMNWSQHRWKHGWILFKPLRCQSETSCLLPAAEPSDVTEQHRTTLGSFSVQFGEKRPDERRPSERPSARLCSTEEEFCLFFQNNRRIDEGKNFTVQSANKDHAVRIYVPVPYDDRTKSLQHKLLCSQRGNRRPADTPHSRPLTGLYSSFLSFIKE